jgi:hypothetical protein
MLRIEPRLAFINGVLLANRVLIFRFQLLAVYVLLVHNCGECRIEEIPEKNMAALYSRSNLDSRVLKRLHTQKYFLFLP